MGDEPTVPAAGLRAGQVRGWPPGRSAALSESALEQLGDYPLSIICTACPPDHDSQGYFSHCLVRSLPYFLECTFLFRLLIIIAPAPQSPCLCIGVPPMLAAFRLHTCAS